MARCWSRTVALTVAAVALGCARPTAAPSTTTTTSVVRDCPTAAVTASLGAPDRDGGRTTDFTTDGSPIYVTMDVQRPSGFMPGIDTGSLSIGPIDRPPVVDRSRGAVANAEQSIGVKHGQLSLVRLRAGRYWLLESNNLLLTAEGCAPGALTDIEVAAEPDPATGRFPPS